MSGAPKTHTGRKRTENNKSTENMSFVTGP